MTADERLLKIVEEIGEDLGSTGLEWHYQYGTIILGGLMKVAAEARKAALEEIMKEVMATTKRQLNKAGYDERCILSILINNLMRIPKRLAASPAPEGKE